jgi:septal ring factor EnvC (AmiA/AmiB activator)
MSDEHLEANVEVRQSTSWQLIVSIIVGLGGMVGIYTSMVANDREFAAQLKQMHDDTARIEHRLDRESKDLRADIRADLVEIKTELRELRADIGKVRR